MHNTADLYDEFTDRLQVAAEPILNTYGGSNRFCGPITTVNVFEDNTLVRKALTGPRLGGVLVVDGGGSLWCALVGGRLARLAIENEWSGIVVFRGIRDPMVIRELPVGVTAVNTSPVKSDKRGEGQRDIALRFAGVVFRPEEYLYADADGVVRTAAQALS